MRITVKIVVTKYKMDGIRYRELMVMYTLALATVQDKNILKECQHRYSYLLS